MLDIQVERVPGSTITPQSSRTEEESEERMRGSRGQRRARATGFQGGGWMTLAGTMVRNPLEPDPLLPQIVPIRVLCAPLRPCCALLWALGPPSAWYSVFRNHCFPHPLGPSCALRRGADRIAVESKMAGRSRAWARGRKGQKGKERSNGRQWRLGSSAGGTGGRVRVRSLGRLGV